MSGTRLAHSGGIQAVIGSQAGVGAALRIVLLQAVSLFSLAMHIRAFHSGIMAFSGGALRTPFLLSLDSESAISVPMDKHLLGVALGMGGWGVILLGASFIIGFESLGWLDGAALAGNSTVIIHPLPDAFLCSKQCDRQGSRSISTFAHLLAYFIMAVICWVLLLLGFSLGGF